MPDRYYDVVVLGRSIGALGVAALLARRDFAVLLFGQGQPPPAYTFERHTLRRRATPLLGATTPAWRRILGELAYSQNWNRKVCPIAPMIQVVTPRTRLDVPPDVALFAREVQREHPEVRRQVAELYEELARVTEAADRAFERDAVWPPGSFLERRQTNRLAASLPYTQAAAHADLLGEFPRTHSYRRIVGETARFASDLAGPLPAFAVARLHGLWTRGTFGLRGGAQELESILVDRITANGGRCLLDERVVGLEVRRGAVSGVVVEGEPGAIGAGFVVTDMMGEQLAALSAGQGLSKRALREWPRVGPACNRLVFSIVARQAGVPPPLGPEAFLLGGSPTEGPDEPPIHLQRCEAGDEDHVLIVAELLLPGPGRPAPRDLRARVVARLCAALPFLERHLVLVDSVHDGHPPWRYDETGVRPVTPTTTSRLGARPETPEPQLEVDPPGFLGLGGEPVRGPIERSLLVGPSVLPGLGQEGMLLAAWSAARIVTRSDKRRARMRRELWTKIEIS